MGWQDSIKVKKKYLELLHLGLNIDPAKTSYMAFSRQGIASTYATSIGRIWNQRIHLPQQFVDGQKKSHRAFHKMDELSPAPGINDKFQPLSITCQTGSWNNLAKNIPQAAPQGEVGIIAAGKGVIKQGNFRDGTQHTCTA